MLREFSQTQDIPFRLLSDVDSEVIRRYGILNDEISRDDLPLYGIPYPGVYVTDEDGVVVAKFFHDTYKKRDSPETLLDAALGRVVVSEDAPRADGGDDEVRISAFVQGGKGTIRQGIIRRLVVRCELDPGMHIYGEPVPEGMVPTSLTLSGPDGLEFGEPELPPTETLHLESMGIELPVWSGTVDLVVPFYPTGVLASETRPLDQDSVEIEVTVRYQACNDDVCYPPTSETLTLKLALDVIDVPALGVHMGHGQREAGFSGTPHMLRLVLRKLRHHPMGLPRFVWKVMRLEREARRRAREGTPS